MKPDKELIKKLLQPLIGSVGLKPSEYFSVLKKLGVEVGDNHHIVNDKFLRHFQYLISTGGITNASETKILSDFGVVVGADGYISLCDSATIMLGEPSQNNLQKAVIQWFVDKLAQVVDRNLDSCYYSLVRARLVIIIKINTN